MGTCHTFQASLEKRAVLCFPNDYHTSYRHTSLFRRMFYFKECTQRIMRLLWNSGRKQPSKERKTELCLTFRSDAYGLGSCPERWAPALIRDWAKTRKIHFYHFDTNILWDNLFNIKVFPNLSSKSRLHTSKRCEKNNWIQTIFTVASSKWGAGALISPRFACLRLCPPIWR